MLTIIVADSHGRYLDTLIDDENILVSFHSGANLLQIANKAIDIISRFRPQTVVLMAGINDITVLSQRTRKVSLISNSCALIINHLIGKINQAKYRIHMSHPDTDIVFGGIMGIDVNKYNRIRGTSPVQWVVDDAITVINAYIRQMNTDSGLPHPRLTSKVGVMALGKMSILV